MTTKYEKEKKRYEEEDRKRFGAIKWDKKSIIILVIIILSILSLIIVLEIDFKRYSIKSNENWSTTCGNITYIRPIDVMEQTRIGNRYVTEGYIVGYNYVIDGIKYQDSTYLTSRAIRNKLFIKKNKEGDVKRIYYNKTNHKESYLDTDFDSTCE